jgi:Flp pilus assembly pilin Flp
MHWLLSFDFLRTVDVMTRIKNLWRRLKQQDQGAVFVEYLLLLTLVGIGVIAGLAAVRVALLSELDDLVQAISNISP